MSLLGVKSPDITQFTNEERQEIIAYGWERTKVILISVAVVLGMGMVFRMMTQSVIFFMAFSMIRRYAGGYHADSQKRCYVISFVILLISFGLIKMGYFSHIYIQGIATLLICALAPVENANHRLEECEKKRYGRKTRIRAVGLFLFSCVLWYWQKEKLVTPIVVANLVVVFSLIAGVIKNKYARD